MTNAVQFRKFTGLMGGSVVQFVSLAFLGLILGKYLTVEEFGITRTIVSYMIVLTILGHLTMHDAISTYVASAESRKEKSQYVLHGAVIVMVASTLLATIFYLLAKHSGMWTGLTRESLATVVLSLPLECLSIVIMSLINATGRLRAMAGFSMVYGVVPLVLIAPSAAIWGLQGWVVARIVSCCIVFGLGVCFVREFVFLSGMDVRKALDLLRFSRVQFMSGMLSTAMLSGDVIALERLTRDSREVGHYGLAVLFSRPLTVVSSTLGRFYFKDIASKMNDIRSQREAITRLLKLALGSSCLLALVVFLCGGTLIGGLYGADYQDSVRVVKILSVTIISSGVWSALSTINTALKCPAFSVMTSLIGVTVAGTMLLLLVPSAGAVGAAWSMNAAYIAGCGMGITLLMKKLKERQQCMNAHCAQ